MSGSPVRAGIVGAGFIGSVHAYAVRAAGGVVTAVAGSTPERSVAAAGRLGAARAAASVEELVAADDVDAVHICTPNALHVPLAERALQAGKHVVCEKPLATSAADARRLTESAARAGVIASVPFVYRYYPTVREARARIARDGPERLWLLHGSYLQDWLADSRETNWRVDPAQGGRSRAYADIGVHWCDLMEFVTGHRITRLVARTATAYAERGGGTGGTGGDGADRGTAVGTEDGAALLFQTDRGATGSLVVSQVSPGRKNRLWFSFDGHAASYSFDQELPDSLWVGSRAENRVVPRDPATLSPGAAAYARLPAGHPQGYQDCFTAYVADVHAAIRRERPDGLPTFPDGLRAAVLTDAVVDSAARESWVEVPACSWAS